MEKNAMPRGYPSFRSGCRSNAAHNLSRNRNVWWVTYTLHFDGRKRRIRRSLRTRSLAVAIRRRDELFATLVAEGEWVPDMWLAA
jgi:hypothetical protein